MDVEQQVAAHYGRSNLERTILDALIAVGKDIEKLAASDLSGADEFHLGWRPATEALARQLGLTAAMHLLDVGSGLGGSARYFAETYGCRVTGIDLTPEFVDTANALTRRCGLADRVEFKQASALALPFAAGVFDVATLVHVGMNIQDKASLFAQMRRVIKDGARIGVYDVMRVQPDEVPYPMPWAASPATSFLESPETYRGLLAKTGFEVQSERNQRELVLKLSREMREKAAARGVPSPSLHTLLRPSKERLDNVMAALERGTIAPIEMVARAV
jgi:ubiquinone/menaquinone biosynthesis C-methylase UbiE